MSAISGYYNELLESSEYNQYENDYLEIELKDTTVAGSPMKGLSARFPYLLSIRRQLNKISADDAFPEREGKSIEDDFESFQKYLYGSEASRASETYETSDEGLLSPEDSDSRNQTEAKLAKASGKNVRKKRGSKAGSNDRETDSKTGGKSKGGLTESKTGRSNDNTALAADEAALQEEKKALFEAELVSLYGDAELSKTKKSKSAPKDSRRKNP
ncbi:MAG: hypothetical protein CMF59_03295 [Leptospiraceae bacterium]|nr:hypothetical protein [Leptospiraceae bacterium]